MRIVVPVSGGKDSQLTLEVAIEEFGRECITCVHNYTGTDHKLTYRHMAWMSWHYRVPIEFAYNDKYRDIFEMMERRSMIPGRHVRTCTEEFKIRSMNRWLMRQPDMADIMLLFGMRAPESQNRNKSYGHILPTDVFSMRELFPRKTPKMLAVVKARLPIVHWSTGAVFQHFASQGTRINPLYARGHRRVGCYPCLLAGPRDWQLAARDPQGRQHIIRLDQLKRQILPKKDATFALSEDEMMSRDLSALLFQQSKDNPKFDPLGFLDDDTGGGCSFCAAS